NNVQVAQPPGMAVLLLPFSWLAHAMRPVSALVLARGATAVATVLDVFLVALAARAYGAGASLLSGVFTALYPFAFMSTSGVTVGPWILLFTILALHAGLKDGQLTTGGRLFLAGVLLGFAVSIKPWALVPALVLTGCAVTAWRTAVAPLIGGIAVGGLVPSLFFLAAAPGAFVRDVVLAELPSGPHASATSKLAELLGFGAPSGFRHPTEVAVFVGVALLVVVTLVFLIGWTSATPYDWFVYLTALLLGLAVLLPGAMSPQYGEFALPFVALAVAVTASRLLEALAASWSGRSSDIRATIAGAGGAMIIAAAVVVVAVAAPSSAGYAATFAHHHGIDPRATIDREIPKGACTIGNNVTELVAADRFAADSQCPPVVSPDSVLAIAKTNHDAATALRVAASQWEQWMSIAHFVVISDVGEALPWTRSLVSYFHSHYALAVKGRTEIYVSRTLAVSPS
ncbi:MAG: hypothetical protein ACRDZT_07435, partial [Acidimicrobiales bacterium]